MARWLRLPLGVEGSAERVAGGFRYVAEIGSIVSHPHPLLPLLDPQPF